MAIKTWPIEERPREKFLKQGGQSLSDAELLALFLRVGVQGMDAVSLAREVLTETGGLGELMALDMPGFNALRGMGPARFVELQAALELSRRCLEAKLKQASFLNSTSMAQHFFQLNLKNEEREVFAVAFLNSQYQLITWDILFQGTINAAQVYIREIVRAALKYNAAAVVLAHNHPSGCIDPSDADRRMTERIIQGLKLVDIQVLDHIIIGQGAMSFAEKGFL